MFNSNNSACRFNMIVLLSYAIVCIAPLSESFVAVHGYPTSSMNLFSHSNKFGDKIVSNDDQAERSFQKFIQSKPDSVLIGEIKPNSSDLEMLLLKNKIASTILSMQEMDKVARDKVDRDSNAADCYIEVTRVERVAGKCHKVNNGLPICQSENYMSINPDCN